MITSRSGRNAQGRKGFVKMKSAILSALLTRGRSSRATPTSYGRKATSGDMFRALVVLGIVRQVNPRLIVQQWRVWWALAAGCPTRRTVIARTQLFQSSWTRQRSLLRRRTVQRFSIGACSPFQREYNRRPVADYSRTRSSRLRVATASCFYDCVMSEPDIAKSRRHPTRPPSLCRNTFLAQPSAQPASTTWGHEKWF
eukprot:62008-Pleurochrysis_carterae.AAC.2